MRCALHMALGYTPRVIAVTHRASHVMQRRELRAALVDMEEFFQILQTPSNIKDGTAQLPPRPLRPRWLWGQERAPAAAATAAKAAAVAVAEAPVAPATADGGSHVVQAHQQHTSSSSSGSNGVHTWTGGHGNGTASSHQGREGEAEAASNGHLLQRHAATSPSAAAAASLPAAGDQRAQLAAPSGGLEVELADVWFGYTQERPVSRVDGGLAEGWHGTVLRQGGLMERHALSFRFGSFALQTCPLSLP